MKPTMGRIRRRGPSPIMPRKLTKRDIYPQVEEMINKDEETPDPEPLVETNEAGKSIQNNSTILSKRQQLLCI